jgi:cytochrome P450
MQERYRIGHESAFALLRSGSQPDDFDPYPLYHSVRRHAPVWESPWGSWYVSSFDAVARAFTDPACALSPWGRKARKVDPESLDSRVVDVIGDWLLFADPIEHEPLRQELLKPLTPAAVAALEPLIAETCRALLPNDGLAPVEVISELAQPLPVAVIARLVGIPPGDRAKIAAWARALRTLLDAPETAESGTQAAMAEMCSYFLALVQDPVWLRAQEEAGRNRLSALLRTVPPQVTAANLAFLVFAGHETTVHLMGSLLLHLALRPQLWAELRANPALVPDAVAEALRFESPVQKMCRWTSSRVELEGCTIPPHQTLVLLLGAANRDPARFPDPDRFDIGRDASSHLSFGRGRHQCLGRLLAVLEASTLLRVLLPRWKSISVEEGGFRWLNNSSFRGLSRLDLAFEFDGAAS